jgi:hypothetical protein
MSHVEITAHAILLFTRALEISAGDPDDDPDIIASDPEFCRIKAALQRELGLTPQDGSPLDPLPPHPRPDDREQVQRWLADVDRRRLLNAGAVARMISPEYLMGLI